MSESKRSKKRRSRRKSGSKKKKDFIFIECDSSGTVASNTVAKNLKNSSDYLQNELGVIITEKDKLQTAWVEKRAEEIRKIYGSRDSFIFLNAAITVSELERLYDTIEMAVRTKFPAVNVDDFFKTIQMYMGRGVSGSYTYLTDWKTLMFTIGANLPESGTFPTLGLHYDLVVCSGGLLGILTKQGNMIAMIPVMPGIEKAEGSIYPQNGEPLENGNLEYVWEECYELNRLAGNEEEWFKSMKYYDEVLEHTLSNDLFNRKKIMRS